jgi:hypothetical protein
VGPNRPGTAPNRNQPDPMNKKWIFVTSL